MSHFIELPCHQIVESLVYRRCYPVGNRIPLRPDILPCSEPVLEICAPVRRNAAVQRTSAVLRMTRVGTNVGRVVVLFHLTRRGVHPSRFESNTAARLDCRVQIYVEREDVEGENECYHPLQDGCYVVHLFKVRDNEGNGEAQFNKNKYKLDPK